MDGVPILPPLRGARRSRVDWRVEWPAPQAVFYKDATPRGEHYIRCAAFGLGVPAAWGSGESSEQSRTVLCSGRPVDRLPAGIFYAMRLV